MKTAIVPVSEIARCGGVLSAAYYTDRLGPDETYDQWKERASRERHVAHVQRHLARLGGLADHGEDCACLGSGVVWGDGGLGLCPGEENER